MNLRSPKSIAIKKRLGELLPPLNEMIEIIAKKDPEDKVWPRKSDAWNKILGDIGIFAMDFTSSVDIISDEGRLLELFKQPLEKDLVLALLNNIKTKLESRFSQLITKYEVDFQPEQDSTQELKLLQDKFSQFADETRLYQQGLEMQITALTKQVKEMKEELGDLKVKLNTGNEDKHSNSFLDWRRRMGQ